MPGHLGAPDPPDDAAEAAADGACGIVRAFATAHGWQDRMDDCFYDDVQVYDEAAMGPQWFYEGFAVLAAGQALLREGGIAAHDA